MKGYKRTYNKRRADGTFVGPATRQQNRARMSSLVSDYRTMKHSPSLTLGASLRQPIGETKALVVSSITAAPGGASLACNATGSIICLNQIQAGSSFFNRIGRKIEMKTVRIFCIIQPANVIKSPPNDLLRVALIYDRQTNGALPAITDIFQDTEQNATNTTDSYSGINLNNRDRFLVVSDRRIMLPNVQNVSGLVDIAWPNSFSGNNNDYMIDDFRKLGNLVTHYKADSSPAVIGDIATGALLLVVFSTLTAGTEAFTILNWNVRLRYKDV